jgi:hypothetical protein
MRHALRLLTLLLLASLPGRAELGLALAPMRVEIKMAPGGQYTDSLRLTNDSDGPSRIRAELLDWYLDDTMTPQFADRYEKEKAFSCRDWLQLNPREMDLAEAGTFRVRYTLRVPGDTPPGEYHCGAGFVTLPPVNPESPPMGMYIAVRAVTAIYVVVGEPDRQPVFRDLTLRSLPGGGHEAVALFENQGLRHFRIQGFIEVRDAAGAVLERVDYPHVPVLGMRAQSLPLRINTPLAPGTYTLRSLADVGLPEALEATARVVVEEPANQEP